MIENRIVQLQTRPDRKAHVCRTEGPTYLNIILFDFWVFLEGDDRFIIKSIIELFYNQ